MEEYKSNSNRSKEEKKISNKEEKRAEKIVTGIVKKRKKSGLSKFTEEFISEDAKNVKSYVFGEVLMPALKKAISDIVTDGINIILYGESRGGSNRRSQVDKVSYRNYYDRDYKINRESRPSYNSGYSYDDIILSTRGEAEDVLMSMEDLIDKYGLARVADFYDLVGVTGNYTDNNFGWTNLVSATIIRVRDGYIIKMPRAIAID